jgi:hypothetical protein
MVTNGTIVEILEDFDGKRNYWVLGPMNVTEQSKRPE